MTANYYFYVSTNLCTFNNMIRHTWGHNTVIPEVARDYDLTIYWYIYTCNKYYQSSCSLSSHAACSSRPISQTSCRRYPSESRFEKGRIMGDILRSSHILQLYVIWHPTVEAFFTKAIIVMRTWYHNSLISGVN